MLFQDLLCDEALKQQLIGMVQEKRISHAQLFLSSPGAHAFAVAIAYAQYSPVKTLQNRTPAVNVLPV